MPYALLSLALRVPEAFAIGQAPIRPPESVGIASGGAVGVVCLGLTWLFTAAILFSIVMALVAAFEYMQGGSSPDKVKKATSRLIFVAIGVAVAILARTVPVLVGTVIGAGGSADTSSLCP